MGAEPVPVVAAGVPCQNSGTCSHHSVGELGCGGQQGGIPMEEMPQYVQDVLDLIEYANGDAKKTEREKHAQQASDEIDRVECPSYSERTVARIIGQCKEG